jgi:2-haloacid dehalogenase
VKSPAAYVFDLFGTLLDFGSLRTLAAEYAREPDRFMELWRNKQIALSQAATVMGRYVPFGEITAGALSYAAALCGARIDPAGEARLCAAWTRLPAFEDARSAVRRLHARGTRLAVLTNGSAAMLHAALEHAGFADSFAHLISVDEASMYKPAPPVYQLAALRFGDVPRERIGFVSSNGWDAAGASEFGFEVFWCNRSHAPPEPLWKPPAHTISSLDALP